MTDFDTTTGEILDDDAPVSGTLRRIENDGVPVPKNGRDAASVIAMLEDGDFNRDVAEDMRDLVQAMEAHAHNNKGVAKGKITITLDVQVANGVFVLTGGHTVKKPVAKRMGTALFAREDGALGRSPAGQYRSLGHQGDIREAVVEQDTRDI